MNIEKVYELLDERLRQRYGKRVQIDKGRFEKDLQKEHGVVNISDIDIPIDELEFLVTIPLRIKDYAKLNGVSYGYIHNSYSSYATMTRDRRRIYIAKYELLHSKRLELEFESKLTQLLYNDTKLLNKLEKDAKDRKCSLSDIIIHYTKEYCIINRTGKNKV